MRKLKGLYIKEWKLHIFNDVRSINNQKNKLRTFRLFKTNFNFEPYSDLLNSKQRQALTKQRIGDHQLSIETGRQKNIPAHKHICKLCEEEVEDEIHFHLRCKKLETYRIPFIQELYISYPNLFGKSILS
mgnify:CR=1 FL=1